MRRRPVPARRAVSVRYSRVAAQASAICSLGARYHGRRRQFVHQTEQRRHLRMFQQSRAVGLDEFDRPTGIARGQGVVDRLHEHVVVGKPFHRFAVQRCTLRWSRSRRRRRNCRTGGGSGTNHHCHRVCAGRGRASTSSSRACPRGSPLSADASDPQIRSAIEVVTRNRNISGSSALRTFSARKSAMAWRCREMGR